MEPGGGVHAQIDQMRKDAAKEDYVRTRVPRLCFPSPRGCLRRLPAGSEKPSVGRETRPPAG